MAVHVDRGVGQITREAGDRPQEVGGFARRERLIVREDLAGQREARAARCLHDPDRGVLRGELRQPGAEFGQAHLERGPGLYIRSRGDSRNCRRL